MPKLTPTFLVTFETEVKGIVVDNWRRVIADLMWDRLMKLRPASTKTNILTWLLETARIYPEGNGGNKRFDDIVAAATSFDIEDFGAGLDLTKNEIEDNQLKTEAGNVGALDYAAKWAKDVSASSAYHPQESLFKLIKAGTTSLCYDGLPFFSKVHTVNPNGGGGTYSNIIENVPLVVASGGGVSEQDARLIARRNLGKVVAHISKLRFLNGVPRRLKPRTLVVPSDLKDEAEFLVGATVISQNTNTIDRAARLEVVCAPELDDEPSNFYVGVDDLLDDELGGFIYSERMPFGIQMYGPQTEAVLNRMKKFQWSMDGRNTATYGHPFLFFKCFPGAAP